ncbi:MAG TPA: TIGR03435 family protein [Bryobacteraceae bacterium]|nr:TIGR03435 family protein [Bryobacteraceae bacterium]
MGTMFGASLGFIMAAGLFAQSGTSPLTFEVASIKPAAPDARGTSLLFQPGGSMRVTNAPVRMLITFAYDIRDFQLTGGPSWINADRYDVLAKPQPGSEEGADPRKMSDAQRQAMAERMRERMRNLLADRFHLTVRRETREGPVYALVVAKGGSKLETVTESADGPVGLRMERGQLSGMAAQLPMLANVLSSQLGRPVIDKTELTGKYNFKLQFAIDQPQTPPPGDSSKEAAPVSTDPDGPSIFTALQEQLGLRLESQKGPIPYVVIDRIEKPTEN